MITAEQREKIEQIMRDALGKEFAWGVHDCGIFAADCIIAICGIDVAVNFRGKYSRKEDAVRYMDSIFRQDTSMWSGEPVDYPEDGDLCFLSGRMGRGFGIFWQGAVVQPSQYHPGLVRVNRAHIVAAYRFS